MECRKRKVTCAGDNSDVGPEPLTSVKLHQQSAPISKTKRLFGFDGSDVLGFNKLVSLLYTPRDPSSLGILRIVYGRLYTKLSYKLQQFCLPTEKSATRKMQLIDISSETNVL